MSKLKLVLLAATGASFGAMVSCSKSNNNNNGGSNSGSDSVLYSNWIPLHLVISGTPSDSVYEQKITANALTQTVLNKGLVMVYANETGSGGQYINYVSDFGIYPTFGVQAIYLDAYNYAGYQLSTNQIVDSVRYVIIPGKVSTTGASGNVQTYTPSQLRQLDYNTVTRVLNIPAHGSSLK
ncbi:MAG TPA: hypothetical protein VHE54_06860 [Puia sp.]|nr:hypothetical protein [Puia sp.]